MVSLFSRSRTFGCRAAQAARSVSLRLASLTTGAPCPKTIALGSSDARYPMEAVASSASPDLSCRSAGGIGPADGIPGKEQAFNRLEQAQVAGCMARGCHHLETEDEFSVAQLGDHERVGAFGRSNSGRDRRRRSERPHGLEASCMIGMIMSENDVTNGTPVESGSLERLGDAVEPAIRAGIDQSRKAVSDHQIGRNAAEVDALPLHNAGLDDRIGR